ncbi:MULTISPECIES: hypothetical protein [unclassified Streptomyces]|uniref:hypothetical protein n=1 Tax=unclassified Streptomyces TaxID=2593676 RepID=UPI003830B5D1
MITTEDPGKWNVALTRRRTLLAGAALGGAALLVGCSEDSGPGRTERDSGTERLRAGAADDSTALLARYDATLSAHPALAARLRPLRSEVARHVRAFADDADAPAPGGGAGSGGPAHRAAGGAEVPKDEKAARASLAEAERKLADARTKALVDAPPEVARLLASVAASGAAHAYLLAEGGA